MAASRDDGTTFRNAAGHVPGALQASSTACSRSGWTTSACSSRSPAILPEVAAYEAGLLDFLLRGELTIQIGPTIVVGGKGLGAGTVEILVEDERGVRTSLTHRADAGRDDALAKVAARRPAPVWSRCSAASIATASRWWPPARCRSRSKLRHGQEAERGDDGGLDRVLALLEDALPGLHDVEPARELPKGSNTYS